MRVLILGASGYIGRALFERLRADPVFEPVRAARSARSDSAGKIVCIDTLRADQLRQALQGFDCVVNCVAGSHHAIAAGAKNLALAAGEARVARIVHMSTMSVYGPREGVVDESAPLDGGLGWYGSAKCEAEAHLQEFATAGGRLVSLRPGSVAGAGSELWVGRVGRWLTSRRVGELGSAGDGWTNLVHIQDVCEAVVLAIRLGVEAGEARAFNIAAPDAPRWNDYLVDLAIAIGATPVRRIGSRRLAFDSNILSPPLKVAEKLLDRLHIGRSWLPDPLPPSLVRFWRQDIRLNVGAARDLGIESWRSYRDLLTEAAQWFRSTYGR